MERAKGKRNIKVIIPALNEANAIGSVIREIPKDWVNEIIVVDNGSIDHTPQEAEKYRATVLHESKKGYGNACLKGLEYVGSLASPPDIVVFIDGDFSDYPEHLPSLVVPILNDQADLVIGSRTLGLRESGSMTVQQRWGNWLATMLIRWLYRVAYTDLGPFRAIRYTSLVELEMKDQNYGWTVEMQLKAAKKSLRTLDVPVNYRRRIGVSKVSGTISGTIKAGYKIIFTILKYV